jgi:serine/threonine protein kinase
VNEKIGTILFMAPEQISKQAYGRVSSPLFLNSFLLQKIDIFAVGITMFYLLTGKHPLYERGNSLEVFRQKLCTVQSQDWKFPSYMSKQAVDLIVNMCRQNQSTRYDVYSALGHPFLTRDMDSPLPLTQHSLIMRVEKERLLGRGVSLFVFLASVKL